jgi:hypothetical protein
VALIVVTFICKTDGASVAVDLKEPKAETTTPYSSKTDTSEKDGGSNEENMSPRMIGS